MFLCSFFTPIHINFCCATKLQSIKIRHYISASNISAIPEMFSLFLFCAEELRNQVGLTGWKVSCDTIHLESALFCGNNCCKWDYLCSMYTCTVYCTVLLENLTDDAIAKPYVTKFSTIFSLFDVNLRHIDLCNCVISQQNPPTLF